MVCVCEIKTDCLDIKAVHHKNSQDGVKLIMSVEMMFKFWDLLAPGISSPHLLRCGGTSCCCKCKLRLSRHSSLPRSEEFHEIGGLFFSKRLYFQL